MVRKSKLRIAAAITAFVAMAGLTVATAASANAQDYNFGSSASWQCSNNTIAYGFIMNPNLIASTDMISSNGNYVFKAQADGNLVVYYHSHAIWNSHTAGSAEIRQFAMQCDGNLVLYGAGSAVRWTAGSGHGLGKAYVLDMQNDGNLVEYMNGVAIWDTGTSGLT